MKKMALLILFQIFFLPFAVNALEEPFRIIAKPFSVREGGRKYKYVHRKDNVNISCQTNLPTATVYLLFSTRTYNETAAHFGKRLIRFNQTFMLKDVRLADGNKFFCFATNGYVNRTLHLGSLRVNRAPCKETPKLEYNGKILSPVIKEKDDELKISCAALGNGDENKYPLKWVRLGNEEMLRTFFKKKIIDRNTNDELVLSISNVQQSSAGTYRCVRKVEKCAENTETYSEFVLKVTKPQAPIVYVKKVKIKVGLNVSIDCNVEASPAPDIQWKNKHGKVIKECFKERHCTFEIKRVETTHSGNYTCIASNSEGIQRSQSEVSVLTAPKIVKGFNNTNRMLSCQVTDGIPIPNVYWQKCIVQPHGKSCNLWIDMNDENANIKIRTMIAGHGYVYSEIKFLSTDDFGYYRCVALNSIGNASDSIYLPKAASDSTLSLKESTWIGLICGFLLLTSLFIIFIICYRKYMIHKYAPFMTPNKGFKFDHNRTIFEQSIELPYDIEWEFPRKRLDWKMKIGSGAFGEVWMANAFGIAALAPRDKGMRAVRRRTILRCNQPVIKEVVKCVLRDDACNRCSLVAVKTLKESFTDEEYKDLASEIKILIHLGNHKNIVNILGACTYGGKLVSIMEFCPHGNLLNFLQSRRNLYSYDWNRKSESYDESFCLFDVAYGALQIARGMQFLSSKKFVHRDLAARNVLVADNYVLKVADFGLTRDVYKTDVYYKKGSGILPVKWMAPESIFDKKYDVKSDVWSFGVVMWEICTMGGTPYCGIQTAEIFEYLQQGHRMKRPEHCPEELYQIIELCWEQDPVKRPMFHEIESQLEGILRNKSLISNNLAAFERLRTFSDETDYLIPTSPSRLKSNSLDAILDFRKGPVSMKIPRKRSLDNLFNFPLIDDVFHDERDNNNGIKYENHYFVPPKHNGMESFF